MRYLLQIALGPVQGFIKHSRRSRDLWYSSWLLSELSKAVAYTIQPSATLIFPSFRASLEPGSATNVANKILAKFTGTEMELKQLIAAAQQSAQARLQNAWTTVYQNLPSEMIDAHAQKQIDDFLEYTWVALPFDFSYSVTRKELDRLLAATKATRTFIQPTWGSSRLKSSLDGEREGVLVNVPAGKRLSLGIRTGEELAAIDLLKRAGIPEGERQRFLSTTHMAAIPFFAQLAQAQYPAIIQAWNIYTQALDACDPGIRRREYIDKEYDPQRVFQLNAPAFWGLADGSLFFPGTRH